MQPEIVTLAEAKLFLRVDSDEEDATIRLLIDGATEAALRFANGIDPASPPPSLKIAILTHVCRAFDHREDHADMPVSAERLLAPLRRLEV